jgi:DNA-binding CsgD family transcriptional regulator
MSFGPGTLLADVAERDDVASTMTAVRDTLRTWVGAGPVFVATADPRTGSFTGLYTFDIPGEAAATFYAIEMSGLDVVTFQALRSGPTPIQSLYSATCAKPSDSERWREVIDPLGWGDELRAAVHANGSVWGYVCIHREADDRPFTARDVARLRSLLPAVGMAMRRAAASAPGSDGSLGTGVILVDHHCRRIGTTGAALDWLEEMGPLSSEGLPLLVAGVAREVLDSGQAVNRSITTRTGRAGLIDAALLGPGPNRQVAVVISAASPRHQLDRLAAAEGLTLREQEVTARVLEGLSTQQIADQLVISPNTVQAHLTSIFGKTGVRSRRELIRRLRG